MLHFRELTVRLACASTHPSTDIGVARFPIILSIARPPGLAFARTPRVDILSKLARHHNNRGTYLNGKATIPVLIRGPCVVISTMASTPG